MAMATKSVSSLAVFIILFLVVFEMPEIEAEDNDVCLKEYGGDVGFGLCAPRIFPTLCYTRCRGSKDAKGGKCIWNDAYPTGAICLCDFCSDVKNYGQILSGGI